MEPRPGPTRHTLTGSMHRHPIDDAILIAVLSGRAAPAERRALEEWRVAHPDNEAEYQSLVRTWEIAGELRRSGLATPPPQVADFVRRPEPERLAMVPSPGRRTWWPGLAAASLLLGLAVGASLARMVGVELDAETTVTGAGELATVTMRDGTLVRLGPNSRLGFHLVSGPRDVSLEGRAFFAVRPDQRHPFRVHAAGGQVNVVRSRFEMQARGSEARVVVIEGEVEVVAGGRRANVGAGEMLVVGDSGPRTVEPVAEVVQTLAWTGQFLAFQSTPLVDVAREFEDRFGYRVEILDPALAHRTVTGWFSDQSPEAMMVGICAAVNARCFQQDNRVRMELPRPAASGQAPRAAP